MPGIGALKELHEKEPARKSLIIVEPHGYGGVIDLQTAAMNAELRYGVDIRLLKDGPEVAIEKLRDGLGDSAALIIVGAEQRTGSGLDLARQLREEGAAARLHRVPLIVQAGEIEPGRPGVAEAEQAMAAGTIDGLIQRLTSSNTISRDIASAVWKRMAAIGQERRRPIWK